MSRLIPFSLLVFLFVTPSYSGETTPPVGLRTAILAAVNPEFVRVRPCGVESGGPSSYWVNHLAVEDEWACIGGTALYQCPSGPFAVKFIALLKWKCGCWKVSSISFDAGHVTRQQFIGRRQVPPAILPAWIRWSP